MLQKKLENKNIFLRIISIDSYLGAHNDHRPSIRT